MTNREQFIKEIITLLDNYQVSLSPEASAYWAELQGGKASIGGLTEHGRAILEWLSDPARANNFYSAKEIGEGLFTSSRVISGAARKLITDGYLEKEGKNPVTYKLTNDGRFVLLNSNIS